MGRWRWRSKDSVESADIVGFIGEGTTFTGDLVLKGGARVDGKIVGRVEAPSLLVVGPNGDIEAEELKARRVVVCGNLRGNLMVEERLEIQPGGRVSGRVVMAQEGLVIAPGAIFEGIVEYSRASAEETAPGELAVGALAG
jgi:cytoskeletal protein CcmA (bactofilin family)